MDTCTIKVFSSCVKLFDVYNAGIYHIERLEKRTDSISDLLNQRTYSATEDARLLLNVNTLQMDVELNSLILTVFSFYRTRKSAIVL